DGVGPHARLKFGTVTSTEFEGRKSHPPVKSHQCYYREDTLVHRRPGSSWCIAVRALLHRRPFARVLELEQDALVADCVSAPQRPARLLPSLELLLELSEVVAFEKVVLV